MLGRARDLAVISLALLTSAAMIVHQRMGVPEVTDAGRQRWATMDEAEREDMRDRFSEFEKLDPAEQQRVHQRARRLDDLARKIYRSLDELDRVRLDDLEASKRRELLREMAVEEAREIARRVLDKLPPEDRVRLEAATEEDREGFFLEFEQRQAKRLDAAIAEHGAELLGEQELERLLAMEPEFRRAKFLGLVQRRTVRRIEKQGGPVGFSPHRWERMRALPPDEFWWALVRVRRQDSGFGRPTAEPDAQSARRLILRAMDVQAQGRLNLSELEPAERQRRLRTHQRRRVLVVLREQSLLEENDIQRLEQASDEAFFKGVRELIRPHQGPAGSPRRRE